MSIVAEAESERKLTPKEYDKVRGCAWAEYNRIVRVAWDEYQKVNGTAKTPPPKGENS